MRKNLLSMLMLGAAMLFACCTPNDGNGDNSGDDNKSAFAIGTANITHSSVDVTITPNDAETWWFATIYSENDLNTYAQGDALTAITNEVDLHMGVVNVCQCPRYHASYSSFSSIVSSHCSVLLSTLD